MNLSEFTRKIWETYIVGTNEQIYSFIEFMDPKCVIIGTGEHEVYNTVDKFLMSLEALGKQKSILKFSIDDYWSEEVQFDDKNSLVYGEFNVLGKSGKVLTQIDMQCRFSMMYRKKDDKWLIVHLHHSVANPEQAYGEIYPRTLIKQLKDTTARMEEFRKKTMIDPLTGLNNQGSFKELIKSYINCRDTIVAIFLDLDHFKQVNDTFGHAVGDLVLQKAVEIIQPSFRKEDNISRLGGDEFASFFSINNASFEDIERIIKSKTEKILKKTPIRVVRDDTLVEVTFSIGICIHKLDEETSVEDILELADKAMYEIKKSGKNGVNLYFGDEKQWSIYGNSIDDKLSDEERSLVIT